MSKGYGRLLRIISIAEAYVRVNKVFYTPLFVQGANIRAQRKIITKVQNNKQLDSQRMFT